MLSLRASDVDLRGDAAEREAQQCVVPGHAELPTDVRAMILDRLRTDLELLRDIRRRHVAGDEAQHVSLSGRESVEPFGRGDQCRVDGGRVGPTTLGVNARLGEQGFRLSVGH